MSFVLVVHRMANAQATSGLTKSKRDAWDCLVIGVPAKKTASGLPMFAARSPNPHASGTDLLTRSTLLSTWHDNTRMSRAREPIVGFTR